MKVDEAVIVIALTLWLLGFLFVLANVFLGSNRHPESSSALVRPRWLSLNAAKRQTELIFVLSSPLWIAMMAVIIVFQLYESFDVLEWNVVGIAFLLPCLVIPYLSPAAPQEEHLPLHRRHWVRAHVWLGIVVFVGSYFWTHYFYTLLKANYTFKDKSWCLNDVPLAMYAAAHAYFCMYHSLTNMALRRWYTSTAYTALSPLARSTGTVCLVAAMAWTTALMEAVTIQGFPGYKIQEWYFFITFGSIVYGLYFVVTFPMYYRVGSEEGEEEEEGEGGGRELKFATTSSGESGNIISSNKKSKSKGKSTSNNRQETSTEAEAVTTSGSSSKEEEGQSTGARRRRSPQKTASNAPSRIPAKRYVPPHAGASEEEGSTPNETTNGAKKTQEGNWNLSATALDSLAASMLVTILLDLWRISYIAAKQAFEGPDGNIAALNTLPWFPQQE